VSHTERKDLQIGSRLSHLLKLLVFKLDTYVVLVFPLNKFPIVSTQCTFKACGVLDVNLHEFH